jgi:3-hydroxybutyryl-CoA dehydrogenase
VLEAVAEKTDPKQEIFRWAETRVPEDVPIATNTSGISVTEIASVLHHRGRGAGFHFFNPVLVMRLVEIVRTEWTSDSTIETLRSLADQLGKTPIVCADVEAFVANRCYEALLREAFWLAFEEVTAPWDVDIALKLGYNLPIGPLELQDRIGTWNLLRSVEQQDRLLRSLSSGGRAKVIDMIERGYLGRLEDGSNRGIYEYFQDVLGHTMTVHVP